MDQRRSGQSRPGRKLIHLCMTKRSNHKLKRMKKPGIRARATNAYYTAEQSIRKPATIAPRIQAFLLSLWKARGGGYYGLGYVITFVGLEISLFFSDVTETEGVTNFVSEQVVGLIFRFAFESIINSFLALIWPALLIGKFGSMGILFLAGSFILFQWGVKPRLDGWLQLATAEQPTQEENYNDQKQ